MQRQMLLIAPILAICLLVSSHAFAQDGPSYEDHNIRVVARKDESGKLASLQVCAWVRGGIPVRLVAVDLVFRDSFDKPLAEPEMLLVWNERVRAFCNSWPVPFQAQGFSKWEIGAVIALDCGQNGLLVTHASDPAKGVAPRKLEGIRNDIKWLPRYRDC